MKSSVSIIKADSTEGVHATISQSFPLLKQMLLAAKLIRDRIKRTGRVDIPGKIDALLEQASVSSQTDLSK